MNKLGFGFLRLPRKGEDYDWETINQMVDVYMQQGGTYFDTCYTYLDGNSEKGIKRCVAERKPRESFLLADKLPGYMCSCYEDCQKFFDEELARCGVSYFDVFMLHWLNGRNVEIAERLEQFRFLQEKKREGTARRIGFSYHDSAALLEQILTRHPEVDVVLLQLNYLDWDTAGIESRKCYETCVRHGKKVIAMEPVKGGTLAQIPKEAEALLRSVHADWTPADWALRFVQSLPEVEVCLSGMNTLAQVKANLRPFEPLTEDELRCLWRVREIIEKETAVACTGCGYCIPHCPQHIPIPSCFKMLNEIFRYPSDGWKIRPSYQQLTKTGGQASHCISCHRCEEHCPQRLPIPLLMKTAAKELEA